MARQLNKLTSLSVRNATRRGLYGDGGGLFLQVGASGSKSWVFRWKKAGRFRVMGLGPVHTLSLAEAREKARDCRKLRLDGIDPLEHRRTTRAAAQLDAAKAMTFKECADAYIASHSAAWRSRTLASWEGTLERHVYPSIGQLPIHAIDVGVLMKTIEALWHEKPETANRARGRIERVLDWATVRGYRAGENPARWRGQLESLLPRHSQVRRVEHHAALPYAALGPFMTELRAQEGAAARALEFTILTAARTGEVLGARWDEINATERLWTVPTRPGVKNKKEHRVPLSKRAMAIIEQMHGARRDEFVFPSSKPGRPLSNMAMMMMLRRLGRGDLTVHGFRSTFRDWAAERTSFPAEVAEMALAHAVANQVEAAYRRGDLFQKRRQLAEAWAAFCVARPLAGEVVPIRRDTAIGQNPGALQP
jgi:integrase